MGSEGSIESEGSEGSVGESSTGAVEVVWVDSEGVVSDEEVVGFLDSSGGVGVSELLQPARLRITARHRIRDKTFFICPPWRDARSEPRRCGRADAGRCSILFCDWDFVLLSMVCGKSDPSRRISCRRW